MLGTCMAGGHVWSKGGMRGQEGEHAWQGGMHDHGACMVGACMAGGMHGRGRAWQGACVAGGACVVGGLHGQVGGHVSPGGHAWPGGCVCVVTGGVRGQRGACMMKIRLVNARAVRILLECILVIMVIAYSHLS